MGTFGLVVMSLGLAADSFAAAVARGGGIGWSGIRLGFAVAAVFSLCQVVMALLGWLAGTESLPLIAGIDHWVAFTVLSALGLRMVHGARRNRPAAPRGAAVTLGALSLTGLATSIDSLFAGISLGTGGGPAVLALAIIGGVTFTVSLAGVHLGKQLGRRLGGHAEVAGGLALTALGTVILLDRLAI